MLLPIIFDLLARQEMYYSPTAMMQYATLQNLYANILSQVSNVLIRVEFEHIQHPH